MLRFIATIQVLIVMAITTSFAQAPPVDLPDVETNAAKVSFNVKELSSGKVSNLGHNYLQLTPDGKLATGGYTVAAEGHYVILRVQMLSTASGNSLMDCRLSLWEDYSLFGITKVKHASPDTLYALSPDGSMLAALCDVKQSHPVVARIDLTTQKDGRNLSLEKWFTPRLNGWQSVAMKLSPDGTFLAMWDNQREVLLWDFVNDKFLTTIKEPEDFTSFAISSDNQKLAAGIKDRTTKVYDLKTSKVDQVLEGPDRAEIIQVEFTPDGKYLVTAGKDGKVLFWDTTTWKVSKTITTNAGALNGMALSADSKLVLTAHDASLKGKDDFRGSIRVWDVSSGSLIQEIRSTKPSDDFTQVALSKDGKTLGAYTRADEAYFWQASQ